MKPCVRTFGKYQFIEGLVHRKQIVYHNIDRLEALEELEHIKPKIVKALKQHRMNTID